VHHWFMRSTRRKDNCDMRWGGGGEEEEEEEEEEDDDDP
jgi:hypothetical protein